MPNINKGFLCLKFSKFMEAKNEPAIKKQPRSYKSAESRKNFEVTSASRKCGAKLDREKNIINDANNKIWDNFLLK